MEIDNEILKDYILSSLFLDKRNLERLIADTNIQDSVGMSYLIANLNKFFSDYERLQKVEREIKERKHGNK